MSSKKITICDTVIHPGEIANLALPLPEQHACSTLYMPIKVINGVKKGPCLVVFSTLRGNELNGVEITNRVIEMLDPKDLSGTIIAIPVLNVYGLMHFPKRLPSGSSLADCFPGNEKGSFGERIAHIFTHEILKKADYCVELQTGDLNHNILPQVYCNFENEKARQLAKVFKTPVITNVPLKGNKLRQTTEDLNIPLLVYQAGEAMRFDENAIQLGVDGVLNLARAVNILPKSPTMELKPIFSRDEDWIVAHKGGVLQPVVSLGQTIKKNELIATINDPFGTAPNEPYKSPQDGVVVSINTTPLIHEGLPIFKIASFLDYDKAENVIEEWDRAQPDSYINS